MNDSIKAKLKQFKLSGIMKTFNIRNEQTIKDNLSYVEFIELLLGDELLNRQTNGNNKRIQKAKFPQHKTIEEFNFNYQPSINKRFIYNLGTCEFVRKNENLAFIGQPGTGKSHLTYSNWFKSN